MAQGHPPGAPTPGSWARSAPPLAVPVTTWMRSQFGSSVQPAPSQGDLDVDDPLRNQRPTRSSYSSSVPAVGASGLSHGNSLPSTREPLHRVYHAIGDASAGRRRGDSGGRSFWQCFYRRSPEDVPPTCPSFSPAIPVRAGPGEASGIGASAPQLFALRIGVDLHRSAVPTGPSRAQVCGWLR